MPRDLINLQLPWIRSSSFDLIWIIGPSFFSVAFVFLFSQHLQTSSQFPLMAWVILILGIDVSHVYGTLYRTYFHPSEFDKNKSLYSLLPLIVWTMGVLIYSQGSKYFWSILAYLAVFHFIRQQYGFLKIYLRFEKKNSLKYRFDIFLLYLGTIYPIIFWHTHLPRNFHWFMDDDFATGLPLIISKITGGTYLLTLIVYTISEIYLLKFNKKINLPKNLLIIGTCLSWYTGIVLFNGDLIFTITNVISHGIPYIALVWFYGTKQNSKSTYGTFFSKKFYSIFLFYLSLLFFAYVEEGLWSGFLWREHFKIFPYFNLLPKVSDKNILSWLVPLLTLPQSVHYVLDGFIWKLSEKKSKNIENDHSTLWHQIMRSKS